jgi:dihydroflavonol-4-reductase
MDPVLVTGGSGFVGGAVLARLVAEGRPVRALARSDAAFEAVRRLGAEPVRGDILDPPSLARAASGCGVVYHAAGVNTFCLRDPRPMFEANVTGSENVIRAAAAAGAHRVVYTSSAATLGEATGTIGHEGCPHRGWFLSDYERSKYEAERAVKTLSEQLGLATVSVNPSSVQGPGRTRGTAKILLDYLNGRLRMVVDARMSLVDVADCVQGHLLAETRGVPGERYVLSGTTITVREALALLARVAGIDRPTRRLPPALARAAAVAIEGAARLRKRRPPLCREMIRTILHGHAYDGSRATRELGVTYTPIEESIRRTVAWYVEQGLVETPPAFALG